MREGRIHLLSIGLTIAVDVAAQRHALGTGTPYASGTLGGREGGRSVSSVMSPTLRHSTPSQAYVERGRLNVKRLFLVATCVAALMAVGTTAAFAGEVTGNAKPTAGPDNANSICVFSGQNDDPNAPKVLNFSIAPNGPGGRTQTYGQLIRLGLLSPSIVTPGMTCRGGSNEERTR